MNEKVKTRKEEKAYTLPELLKKESSPYGVEVCLKLEEYLKSAEICFGSLFEENMYYHCCNPKKTTRKSMGLATNQIEMILFSRT